MAGRPTPGPQSLGPNKLANRPSAFGGTAAASGVTVMSTVMFGVLTLTTGATPQQGLAPQQFGPGKLVPARRGFSPPPASVIVNTAGVTTFGSEFSGQLSVTQLPSSRSKPTTPFGPKFRHQGRPLGYSTNIPAALHGVTFFGSTYTGAPPPLSKPQPARQLVGPQLNQPYHTLLFAPRPLSASTPVQTLPLNGLMIFGSQANAVLFGTVAASGTTVPSSAFFAAGAVIQQLSGEYATTTTVYGQMTGLAIGPLSGQYVLSSVVFGGQSSAGVLAGGLTTFGTELHSLLTGTMPLTGLTTTGTTVSSLLTGVAAASGVTITGTAMFGNLRGSVPLSGVTTFGTAFTGALQGLISGPVTGRMVFGSVFEAQLTGAAAMTGVFSTGTSMYGLVTPVNSGAMTGRWTSGTTFYGSTQGNNLIGSFGFGSTMAGADPAGFGWTVVSLLAQGSTTSVIIVAQAGGIQPVEPVFLAGTACIVTASYFDKNGNPFKPISVLWELIDVLTGSVIIAPTSLSAGIVNEVQIPSSANQIISFSRNYERKQVIFQIIDQFGQASFANGFYALTRVGANDVGITAGTLPSAQGPPYGFGA